MKLKTYETPEVEILWVNTEVNFCMSSDGLDDYTVLPGAGDGFFESPAFIF